MRAVFDVSRIGWGLLKFDKRILKW